MSLPVRLLVSISLCLLFYFPFLSHGQSSRKSDILNRLAKQSDTIAYVLLNGQPVPAKELLTLLQRQARWDDEAGPLNPSGLHLRFEKIDEQAGLPGGVAARYRVFAEGAPENKVFAFESWPMDKPLAADPRDVYVNVQGLLMIHRPRPEQETSLKAEGDELVLSLVTGSAEPMRFVLSSMDGQLKVFGTLVPHPVVAEDKGCRLEVRVAQPDATAVLLIVDGFPAKARIPLVLESEGAVDSRILDTNADGHAVMAGFPYLPGKAQGILRASAEGPNCLPTAVLPWGAPAHPAAKTPSQ
jgi:hypothetical protein